MKAIQTKYIGATNRKPARVKAFDMDGNAVTVTDGDAESAGVKFTEDFDLHAYAAKRLAERMKWSGHLIRGEIKGGSVFVFITY